MGRAVGPAWVGPHTDGGASVKHGQQETFGLTPLLDGDEKQTLLEFQTAQSLEECWAQVVAELLTCFPYALPSTAYTFMYEKNKSASDNSFFEKMQDEEDPAHPIVAECQHLCTMGAIWRGFTFQGSSPYGDKKDSYAAVGAYPFTAGDSEGSVTPHGGKWLRNGPHETAPPKNSAANPPASGVPRAIADGYGPGSVYGYQGADSAGNFGGNTGSAHIGFTIRIHPDKLRMQFFDTGGMNNPDESNSRPIKKGNGTYEYEWIQGVNGPAGTRKFVGIGVLPAPPDLKKAIGRALRSRPLGLARLALFRRADKELLYASPPLLMYGPGDEQNFSYTRYLWALRNHPGHERVQAMWMFDTPQGELAKAMVVNPRRTTLGELIKKAGLKKGARPFGPTDSLQQGAQVLALTNFLSEADGKVSIKEVFDQHQGGDQVIDRPAAVRNLPWGEPGGAAVKGLPGDIPAYFKGG